MRTSSDNHKAINDYADSFYGSFLGNQKTEDLATQIIESLKFSDYAIEEIDKRFAFLKSLEDENSY